MDRSRVTAVIPCYNVSRACVDVVGEAARHAGRVIAVNDGSTDDTLSWLKSTGCEVIDLPVNGGKGVALRHGFEAALAGDCDAVVTLDGDGQHRPNEIDSLVAQADRAGSDVVVGVRDLSAMPPRSRFGNTMTRWFFCAQTGKALADTQTGFRLFRSEALRQLMPRLKWGRYETEMQMLFLAARMRLSVAAAPISTVYFDNNKLTSFRTVTDSLRVLLMVLRYAATGLSSWLLETAVFSVIVYRHPERYGVALAAGRGLSLVNHYLLSRFFTFRVRRRVGWGEVASYAGVAGLNLAVSYVILHALIELLQLPAIPALVATQLMMFVVTFMLLQRFTFRVGVN